jgi:hypothetical protein
MKCDSLKKKKNDTSMLYDSESMEVYHTSHSFIVLTFLHSLVYINENVLFGQRNAIEEHKAAI